MVGKYKLILFLVLLLVIQRSVYAKEKVCFTEHHTFEDNKYIDYELDISEESKIAGLTITIRYDAKQLALVDSQVGEMLQSTMNKVNNKVEGTVIITAISTDEITQKGSLLNLRFEIVNSSKEYIDINCSVDECIDQNCDEIPNTIDSKKIKNPLYKPEESNTGVVEEKKESSNEVLNNSDEKEVPSEDKLENVQKNEEEKKEDDKPDDNGKKQEDSSQTGGSLKTETNTRENKPENIYLFTGLISGGVAILILSIMIARRRLKWKKD